MVGNKQFNLVTYFSDSAEIIVVKYQDRCAFVLLLRRNGEERMEDIATKEHFVFVECHWSVSGSSCAFPGGQKTLDPKSNYLIQYIGRRGHEICLIEYIAVTTHTQTHKWYRSSSANNFLGYPTSQVCVHSNGRSVSF